MSFNARLMTTCYNIGNANSLIGNGGHVFSILQEIGAKNDEAKKQWRSSGR